MSQTLMGKIKILVSATLHSIVDQALRQNSLAVFDEYIRQAEGSMEAVRSALIDLSATVKTLKRKYDEASREAAKLDLEVDAALKANKTMVAKAAQLRLNNQIEMAHTYQEQYDKQNAAFGTLQQIVEVLQSKVDVLKSQRDQVATLLKLIKSKNVIAHSIQDVQRLADTNASNIVEDVKSKLDTADARLEVATTRLSDQIDNTINDTNLNAQLEERRQRLGLG